MEAVIHARSALVDISPNLPQPGRSVLKDTGNGRPIVGKPTKQDMTWTQHGGRVDMHDKKARLRHLEAVRARIMRAHDRDRIHPVRGRESQRKEQAALTLS